MNVLQQPAAPTATPTNTMAILALVFAFVFAPLGVVFGFVARGQIKRTGEGGAGLALAGIIVGAIVTVLVVVLILFLFVAVATVDSTLPADVRVPTSLELPPPR